MNTNYFISFFS